MKALRKFAQLSSAERSLLLETGLLLAAIRAALWLLPWRSVNGSLRSLRVSRAAQFNVDRLAWAVRAASRFVPRATCLTQALALHHLLSRAGYCSSVQIGVAKDSRRNFEAHAWVEHDGRTLLHREGDLAGYSRLLTLTGPSA
jgi:hypothetical protein